jgi:hypothetical protein
MPGGFVAYPSHPTAVGQTVEAAVRSLADTFGIRDVETWRESNVVGQFITTRVLEQIEGRNCLIADITELNFNVTFEIGYAIGRARSLILVRDSAVEAHEPKIDDVGIFDTIGYREYQNSVELADILRAITGAEAIKVPSVKLNTKSPVYLIEALYKSDAVTRMVARVKKARLSFRSFDPHEQPRLSGVEAIQNVAQSYGVLLHLLPNRIKDAPTHNMRVAFLAGLATGMAKPLLILQEGDEPVPIDYRDLVAPFYNLGHIDEAIAEFATRVAEALQTRDEDVPEVERTFLETLTLGASAAENELKDLSHYYLETDAFRRARRGEVRIAVGRKGSGKTALFLQLRDQVRRLPVNVVLDLKPEGYKLLKFKEDVLSLLQEGTVDHTLTAFWEYLLLLEICRKVLENDKVRHMRDGRLYEPYRRIAEAYESDEYVAEGDFSERMSTLLQRIRQDFDAKYRERAVRRLSQAEVTELLYRHDVAALRREVNTYLRFKRELWLLFDNLDKGWPTHGIKTEDLVILRTLLEATRKLERELNREDIEAHTLIFLRNDVFELLMEEIPDRGKEVRAGVDWTDSDMLRELLRRRIVFNGLPADEPFENVWRRICVTHVDGEETSQYLIDRSFMRPRALLDIVNHCRGAAVNLGHPRIEGDDIKKGLAAYSTDLVRDIGLEIRDVMPEGEEALYAFIDAPARVSERVLREERLQPFGLTAEQVTQLIDTLLWYGVLGLVRADNEIEYIYSVNYDMRLLKGKIRRLGDNVVFGLNPALWPALGVRGEGD